MCPCLVGQVEGGTPEQTCSGGSTDLEACSLPSGAVAAPHSPSGFEQDLQCSGSSTQSQWLEQDPQGPAGSQPPGQFPASQLERLLPNPRNVPGAQKENSQNNFYKYFRAGVGGSSQLGPQLA